MRLATAAAIVVAVAAAAPSPPLPPPLTRTHLARPLAGPPYAGNLTHLLCDVKTALNASAVNTTWAGPIVAALASRMGCNGLRVPLRPTLAGPEGYDAGYNATLNADRKSVV